MPTRSRDRTSRLDAAADRILSLDSPIYGDERERRIVLEASSFGYVVVSFVGLAAAVFAAAAGWVGASLLLLLVASVPGASAAWFAKRRGVDFAALSMRDRAIYLKVQGVIFVLLSLWCGAIALYGYLGHPLLTVPAIGKDMHSMLVGMGIGGVLGGLGGGLWAIVSGRRARRRADVDAADEPDDEF